MQHLQVQKKYLNYHIKFPHDLIWIENHRLIIKHVPLEITHFQNHQLQKYIEENDILNIYSKNATLQVLRIMGAHIDEAFSSNQCVLNKIRDKLISLLKSTAITDKFFSLDFKKHTVAIHCEGSSFRIRQKVFVGQRHLMNLKNVSRLKMLLAKSLGDYDTLPEFQLEANYILIVNALKHSLLNFNGSSESDENWELTSESLEDTEREADNLVVTVNEYESTGVVNNSDRKNSDNDMLKKSSQFNSPSSYALDWSDAASSGVRPTRSSVALQFFRDPEESHAMGDLSECLETDVDRSIQEYPSNKTPIKYKQVFLTCFRLFNQCHVRDFSNVEEFRRVINTVDTTTKKLKKFRISQATRGIVLTKSNFGLYVRAEILTISQYKIQVFLIDIGRYELKERSELFEIDEELKNLPKFTFLIHLHGVDNVVIRRAAIRNKIYAEKTKKVYYAQFVDETSAILFDALTQENLNQSLIDRAKTLLRN